MDPAALRDPGRCPDCATLLTPEPVACAACGLPLRGPLVERLWRLSLQAAQTLEQRQSVIDALRGRTEIVPTGAANAGWGDAPVTVAGGPPPAGPGLAPPRPWASEDWPADAAWTPGPRAAPQRESVSPRQIQQLLLGLGVLLLAVAALIFIVVAWGRIGTGGRTAILVAVTMASAAGSRLALRRELTSTAEALAVLTVGLLLLDAWGVREYEFLGTGDAAGDIYWASVLAGLAAASLLVTQAVPLRTPVWVAAIAVQLPVPVLSERLGATGTCVALVLQGTAALAVVRRWGEPPAAPDEDAEAEPARRDRRKERTQEHPDLAFGIGGVLAWLVGAVGIGLLAYDQLDEESVSNAGGVALLLLAAAAAAFLAWDRRALIWLSTPAAAVATAALLAAGHAPLERSVDHDVATAAAVAILMVVAALVAAVPDDALGELTPQLRLGPLAVLAAAAALAVLDVSEPIGEALGGAFRHVADPWQHSLDADALERLGEPWPFHGAVGFSVVLLTAAAALLAYRLRGTAQGVVASGVTAFGVIATALVVPIAIRAPYLLAVLAMVLLGAAMLVVAAYLMPAVAGEDEEQDQAQRSEYDRQMAVVLVVGGAAALATGLAWSLASSAATAWALAAVAGAALGGRAAIPVAGRAWATALAAAAVIAEVGVLTRIADASGAAAGTTAVAAAGVLAIAARALRDPVERITLEATCVIAAICVGPAIGDDEHWGSIALLIAGVAAAAIAMDPRRRPVGWLSGVLLTGSTWLRLADADVSTPEAYTLPPAAALLIYGAIAQHRNRELSSWRTYGPGLALGLIPSLLVTFDDDGLARPLLLGLAALLVLLAGVSSKLQAPLALGGATLGIDAVIQIGPYVDAVPRWVSIGAAGILLLSLGATFERRLRDVRRLAERFADLG